MSNNNPSIRFKGFTDAWEQRKFSEVFDYLQNNTLSRDQLTSMPGEAKNVHYGDVLIKYSEVTSYDELCSGYIADADIVDKFKTSLLQEGDVIITDTAEDTTVGKCTELTNLGNKKVVSGLHTIPCHPVFSFGRGYLGFYLNSPAFHNQLRPLMQGIKVTSISKTALLDTEILFPRDLSEQSLIGSTMINLNNLITFHQRKLDMLKKVKASLLDKMFPAEGKSVPLIRFKGFTDAWEQRKVEELVIRASDLRMSGELPSVEYEDIESGSGNLINDILKKETSKTGVHFLPGDVLFGKLRPYLKNWLYPSFEGIAVGDFWVLRPSNVVGLFFYYLIQTSSFQNIANQSTGTKMPRADWSLVSKFVCLVPKNKLEQQRIGLTLKHIDSVITLHQRKLDMLKKVKASLLDKMFPAE